MKAIDEWFLRQKIWVVAPLLAALLIISFGVLPLVVLEILK